MRVNKVEQYNKVNIVLMLNVMKVIKVEQYNKVNIVLMLWGLKK